jgi:hypothetical protein
MTASDATNDQRIKRCAAHEWAVAAEGAGHREDREHENRGRRRALTEAERRPEQHRHAQQLLRIPAQLRGEMKEREQTGEHDGEQHAGGFDRASDLPVERALTAEDDGWRHQQHADDAAQAQRQPRLTVVGGRHHAGEHGR